jgi:AraC-like DNA-binding protein
MIEKSIAWQSEAAPVPESRGACRERVRFWQPAPERAQEFTCAYLDEGCAALHVHEEWQFAVASEPSTITLGAYHRTAARVTDVTVVAPYDVHTEGGLLGGPRGWLVLYVAPGTLERVSADAGAVPRFDCSVVRDAGSAHQLATLLQGSLDGSIEASDFTSRVLDWLRQLARECSIAAATQPLRGSAPASVERARAYLQDHPAEPLALSDLVDLAGVTASHLVRSFSRTVGLAPKRYQLQVRLARARRLLAEGRPATWVAYECGFADQSHLSRRFKEFYDLTPGAFQRQSQSRGAAPAVTSRQSDEPAVNAA